MRHVTARADVMQRNRLIHLPSAWGSLGVAQIPMKAGFVGKAALIGPAIEGLHPLADVDVSADTR